MTRLFAGKLFQSLAGTSDLCVLESIPTDSGTHPASFTMVFFFSLFSLFCGLGHLQHESNHLPASSDEPTLKPSWHALLHSYNKSQRDALFLKFILINYSTCFGEIYCPSSGVSTLYTHNRYLSCMTNTYCCVYSVETPDDGQWICLKYVEYFIKINLRNSASC